MLTTNQYKLMPLDSTHVSDQQKVITVELVEGHWPSDKELAECFEEKGWLNGTVSSVSDSIKQITKVVAYGD